MSTPIASDPATSPQRRSRRSLFLALGALDLVILVALVIWRPRAGEDDVAWSERIALEPVPAGYGVGTVYASGDLAGTAGDGVAVLYGEDGADFGSGRWIGVAAIPLDPAAPFIDPDAEFPGESRDPAAIEGVPGAAGTTYDGRQGLVMGPIGDVFVSIVGQGLGADDVADLAADVQIADGVPSIPDATLDAAFVADVHEIARLDATSADIVTSAVASVLTASEGSASVAYDPTSGTAPLQLTNRPAPDGGSEALVRLVLADAATTDVAGHDAWAGTLSVSDYSVHAVAWERGGRLIALVGDESIDDLVALAETARDLTPSEWDALVTPPGG